MVQAKTYKGSDGLGIAYTREGSGVLAFAAEEWVRYTSAMRKKPTENFGEDTARAEVILGSGEDFVNESGMSGKLRYDGYFIKYAEGKVRIGSYYPRGVLFGVYDILKKNGCRFIKAAGVREVIPEAEEIEVEEGVENPDFEHRSLAISGTDITEDWAKETAEIVDWCCKNRINAIFLHENIDNAIRGANAEVAGEIKKRGMIFEFGGHNVQAYVDRKYFESEPELFHMKGGKREKDGNFCTSSERACEMVLAGVRQFLKENEGIDLLHLWFDDAIADSWCSCEKCAGLKPLEQQYRIIDKLYRMVSEEFPSVKIDMLLYHETLDDILQIRHREQMPIGVYAPRERCYAHHLADENCGNNKLYYQSLKDSISVFGKENIEVFEYYSDCILFSKNKTVLAHVIAQDLRDYAACGVRKITSLSFGEYGYWAYDLNTYLYARHSFCVTMDAEATIREYMEALGLNDEVFREYLRKMEEYSRLYFSFCGYEKAYADIRKLPLCGYYEEHLKKIGQAVEVLQRAQKLLEQLRGRYPQSEYLRHEEEILQITRLESEGMRLRMAIRLENAKDKTADKQKLIREFEKVKKNLYAIIRFSQTIPLEVKGVHGGKLLVEHLCKDQIWTVNELVCQELGVPVSLDRDAI